MSELLPCPFCGRPLVFSEALSTRRQDHYVHDHLTRLEEENCFLLNVNIAVNLDGRANDRVEAWNRRTHTKSSSEATS